MTQRRLVQALLCQRYGHRPIPASIDAGEFELLLAQLTKFDKQRELLDTWFRKDANAIPPVYILQKISSIIPQYLSQVPVSHHSTSHRCHYHTTVLLTGVSIMPQCPSLVKVSSDTSSKKQMQ